MWKTIKHYASVYKEFVSSCLTESSSYRLHFFLLIVMDLFFYMATLGSVELIFNHVAQIGLWHKNELLFFISVMLAIHQWHMTFVSMSFWELSHDIRAGVLDFMILRPLSTLFIVYFRFFRPASFINNFFTMGFVLYYGWLVGLRGADWPLLLLLMLLGYTLLCILEILVSCAMFWMLEGIGINFLRIELQKLSRWPDFIYGSYTRKFFTIIFPVLLIGNAPVNIILHSHPLAYLGALVASILFFGPLLRWVWGKALDRYESASS